MTEIPEPYLSFFAPPANACHDERHHDLEAELLRVRLGADVDRDAWQRERLAWMGLVAWLLSQTPPGTP